MGERRGCRSRRRGWPRICSQAKPSACWFRRRNEDVAEVLRLRSPPAPATPSEKSHRALTRRAVRKQRQHCSSRPDGRPFRREARRCSRASWTSSGLRVRACRRASRSERILGLLLVTARACSRDVEKTTSSLPLVDLQHLLLEPSRPRLSTRRRQPGALPRPHGESDEGRPLPPCLLFHRAKSALVFLQLARFPLLRGTSDPPRSHEAPERTRNA